MTKVKSYFKGWKKVEPEMAKEFACWLVSQSMQTREEAIKSANNHIDGVQITEQDYIDYLVRTKENVNVHN